MADKVKYTFLDRDRDRLKAAIDAGTLGFVTESYADWRGTMIFDCIVEVGSPAEGKLLTAFPNMTRKYI